MKIVSNTGPLIGLAKIDRLSILKDIASEVLIPPMVHRKLLGKIGIESDINELRNQGYWISDEVVDIAKHLAGENKIG